MRLVQLLHRTHGRRVAAVAGNSLRLLTGHPSVYALARAALDAGQPLVRFAESRVSHETLDYDAIYARVPASAPLVGLADAAGTRGADAAGWQILPAFDHPDEPARCYITGTGLTHTASAKNRDAMHQSGGPVAANAAPLTDSMRMFQWGVEGGRPPAGQAGVQPEWFWKGTGAVLRGHHETLDVPWFADDGGEEPEIAGCYLVDKAGTVRRVGLLAANEFSDHQMERKNYLYLAPSKLRACAIGPELVLDADFRDVRGTVSIERGGKTLWSKAIVTGEANMCHSLENLEHHQFKYPQHRLAGDAHVHFFGADAFSFGAGVSLQDGDVAVVEWTGMGRALRNPIRIDRGEKRLVRVTPI